MDSPLCCRTCLGVQNLNAIFPLPEHSEKYSEIIHSTTGIKVQINDNLPQLMCAPCIDFINQSYKFRKKCQDTETALLQQLISKPFYEIKIEKNNFTTEFVTSIDITDLIIDSDFRDYDDNMTLSQYYLEVERSKLPDVPVNNGKKYDNEENKSALTININPEQESVANDTKLSKKYSKSKEKEIKKRGRTKKENEEEKRIKEKTERVKVEIQCELCHKVLTSKLSLRNHNKIHTGFDVVCEHCGKKFITRRLLLMHCRAKHGYEKTDKCSYCDYRASNAEQVKIHERLHTGEKPYACRQCDARFHRKSSYLQHVAIHLPDKTVQCDQCPARFKSVTLMRIHRARHSAPRYTYSCRVCDNTFARRRNVVRHLMRIHALRAAAEHIHRVKNS